MTRQEIETALKAGKLWARMANNRLWILRSNGQVKTWKRDASRFEIPCKAGLRACGRISETSRIEPLADKPGEFVVEQI